MAPGRSHRPGLPRGFTLLEVLMVVLLVGILSSVVMLSVGAGGAERHLREEADRLAALLEQAAMEAVMQNQEFGLRLHDDGYAFLCLNEAKQEWDYCEDSLFRDRTLAEGLEVRIVQQAEQEDFALAKDEEQEDREADDGKRITPDVFLLSSGEASPASVEIRVVEQPELRSEIRIDAIGRVRQETEEGDLGAPGGRDAG